MAVTYIVTGANRGLGLELARQLSERGDSVLGTVRDTSTTGMLADLPVEVVPLDVGDRASIAALRPPLAGRAVDVLINNAGVNSASKSIASLDAGELVRAMMVNAVGPLLVVQALLGNLRAGTRRLMVNISSELASITNNKGGSSYGYRASKA